MPNRSVGEFLFDLAKKAGMFAENPGLKEFLANSDLAKVEIPEDIEKAINFELISLKDAKNNHPEIKPYYHAQVLDTFDRLIASEVAASEFDEETKSVLTAKSNVYTRWQTFIKKLKEDKKEAPGKNEKADIQKQLDELHAQIRLAKENEKKIQEDYEKKLASEKIEYRIENLLGGYKTIYDDLDTDVKSTTLKTLISKNLQDNKAKFSVDENGKLLLLKEDGTNYYGDNNQQVEPKTFVEQILSRHKLLKVTDLSSNGNGENGKNNSYRQPSGGDGKSEKNHALSGLVQQSLKQLETNGQVSVMGG